MSFAKVYSAQVHLLAGQIVDVEVDISRGLHAMNIVGLPDKAVDESKDRVSSAIKNSGFRSPKTISSKLFNIGQKKVFKLFHNYFLDSERAFTYTNYVEIVNKIKYSLKLCHKINI